MPGPERNVVPSDVASHPLGQLINQQTGSQLRDPLTSDDVIQISSAKRGISQNMNKTEEVANKIKNLLAKGENEINSEFIRGEIYERSQHSQADSVKSFS